MIKINLHYLKRILIFKVASLKLRTLRARLHFQTWFGNKTSPSGCRCIKHRWQTALFSAASICCNYLSLVSDSDTKVSMSSCSTKFGCGGKNLLILQGNIVLLLTCCQAVMKTTLPSDTMTAVSWSKSQPKKNWCRLVRCIKGIVHVFWSMVQWEINKHCDTCCRYLVERP